MVVVLRHHIVALAMEMHLFLGAAEKQPIHIQWPQKRHVDLFSQNIVDSGEILIVETIFPAVDETGEPSRQVRRPEHVVAIALIDQHLKVLMNVLAVANLDLSGLSLIDPKIGLHPDIALNNGSI
jgi:hypothetical protein